MRNIKTNNSNINGFKEPLVYRAKLKGKIMKKLLMFALAVVSMNAFSSTKKIVTKKNYTISVVRNVSGCDNVRSLNKIKDGYGNYGKTLVSVSLTVTKHYAYESYKVEQTISKKGKVKREKIIEYLDGEKKEYKVETVQFKRAIKSESNSFFIIPFPVNSSRCRSNSDPFFFFKLHMVHFCTITTTTNIFDLVDHVTVKKDTFS